MLRTPPRYTLLWLAATLMIIGLAGCANMAADPVGQTPQDMAQQPHVQANYDERN